MAPVCEPHHVPGIHEEGEMKRVEVSIATSRRCSAILPKRTTLWPKNTSTCHRPPLYVRSGILNESLRFQNRSEVDKSDNTTVVIGSVVGVIILVVAFGVVTCCCMASRKKCEKKKPKDKDKDKDKNKKPKDNGIQGYPAGTYQQVQDWINHHPFDYSPGMPQIPPFAYHGGLGGVARHGGNEMDAPQVGYGGWGYR